MEVPSSIAVQLYRGIAVFARLIIKYFPGMKRFDPRLWFTRFKSKSNNLLFQWANTELKKQYKKGINQESTSFDN